MNIFRCEDNYLIAAIVGAAALIISIVSVLMATVISKGKNKVLIYIGIAGAFVATVVSSLFCFNIIVLAAYIISVICLGMSITSACIVSHQNTIYKLSPLHLFAKIIIPVSIVFELFRPYFVAFKNENDITNYYTILAGFGLNSHTMKQGTYTTYVAAEGISIFSADWKHFNFVLIFLAVIFIAVLVMQLLLIWRQFKDPDNARDWADFGLIITCVGSIFIYGMYTSNNFGIVTQTKVEHVALTIPVIVVIGVLNRILYFEKVENFLDKFTFKKSK